MGEIVVAGGKRHHYGSIDLLIASDTARYGIAWDALGAPSSAGMLRAIMRSSASSLVDRPAPTS
jgi:hypothetical protein